MRECLCPSEPDLKFVFCKGTILKKYFIINLLIFGKLIGALLIIYATYIMTVRIMNIDKEISVANENIAGFFDSRILTVLAIMNYEDRYFEYKMDIFENNRMLTYIQELREKKASQDEIKERESYIKDISDGALFQLASLTKRWGLMLTKIEDINQKKENEIDKILASNLTNEKKVGQIYDILEKNQQQAGERLNEMHKQWAKNKDKKNMLETTRNLWNRIFIWCQIVGLILIAGFETLEAVIKYRQIGRDGPESASP